MVDLFVPGYLELFNGELAGPMPESVPIMTRDALDEDLSGVDVSWRVHGPAGVVEEGSAKTDSRGAADLKPAPPALPGPYILEVAARWERHRRHARRARSAE